LKDDGLAAHALQLQHGTFVGAGFAQWFTIEVGHLV
jgi:hypothetical protein